MSEKVCVFFSILVTIQFIFGALYKRALVKATNNINDKIRIVLYGEKLIIIEIYLFIA